MTAPSLILIIASVPTSSSSGMPASSSSRGPRFGYLPVMDFAAFTTAATRQSISSSALTRSRSAWSMTAMSPGFSRLTRTFVRGSTRATPTMPGGSSALPRPTRGILTDGSFITFHPGITRRLPRAMRGITGCYNPALWRVAPTAAYGGRVTAQPASDSIRLTSLSHGAGCACKLPLSALDQLMVSLGSSSDGVLGAAGAAGGDLLVGAAEGDDAAVLRLDDERALVLTTDFFTPIVDDARDWGRIAAANALSDVYAMGGRPVVALNLTAWPGTTLSLDLLADVLRGGASVCASAGCLVVGGHTIDDPEPKYGMAVVGLAAPSRLLTVDAARPGDTLVLTKALGTGVVATAHKRGAAPDDVLAAAV